MLNNAKLLVETNVASQCLSCTIVNCILNDHLMVLKPLNLN